MQRSPLRRALPAVPASVPELRAQVAEFVSAAGVRDPQLAAVKLAVTEAVSNAVVHAYSGSAPGEVRVVTFIRDGTVYVTVSDDGAGMLPRLDSPGLGIGLPFIVNSADTLQIGVSEHGGTELQMTFRMTA
ncbi:MAG TPA: ATP-binding protein [Solirubrobacteraceae bacterium]|jgi:serine/threonine-protein kinase RsbW/stage II sporulation protein AB (anti-sigma F factor)